MLKSETTDSQEAERLRRLDLYQISRTAPEASFDDIVRLVRDLFDSPMAFLCITEADTNWFKSKIGLDIDEVPRSISFCDQTLKDDGVMVVPNATLDRRFESNPMVVGDSHIRFYAGITLRDADGFALGTLAAADILPRKITRRQKESLQRLANITVDRMELRKAKFELGRAVEIAERARESAISDHTVLRQVIECLPEAIVVTDPEDNLILWNNNYSRMFPSVADILEPGINYEVVVRKDMQNGNYNEAIGDGSEELWLADRLQDHSQAGTTTDLKLNDGRWIRFEQHKTPDGKKVGVRTDITDVKNAAESFRLLFDNNPVPMFVFDQVSFAYLDVNNAAIAHYGYSREQFLNMSLADIRPARDRQKFFDHVKTQSLVSNGELDWTHLKADGSEIIINSYAKPIKYNGLNAALSTAIDVTERRKHDTRIEYQANHDALTDLPNRRLFLERLEAALSLSDEGSQTAVILIDIDNFKSINDTLGHQVGDDLIKGVAIQLREFVGDRGTVGRLGGDEYAILLASVDNSEEVQCIATDLVDLFSGTLKVRGRDIQTGISAGVALSAGVRLTASTLLMNADLALYKAKSDGRGVYRLYEPQMSLRLHQQRAMEYELRHALEKNQLEVHYQPLVELRQGTVVGLEALLRWNHPEKGWVPPSSFIPIAESNGTILQIGNWILHQACLLATTLSDGIAVAVNVSPVQFKSGKFVESVANALKISGLAAHRLELEITESVLLEKSQEMLDILSSLKALGISVALDDFGTGFSGLGYLNSFPIDKIKIDRSFIKDLGLKPKAEVIVRTSLNIGQSLGITTLAEGIETPEQLLKLRALGCNQGQGYLFSPAVPASLLTNLLSHDRTFALLVAGG